MHGRKKDTAYNILEAQTENNNIKRSCQFTHVRSGHNELEINEKDEVPVNIMNSIKSNIVCFVTFQKAVTCNYSYL